MGASKQCSFQFGEEVSRKQFSDWPIEGLEDVIIIRRNGEIGRLQWR
jgi:hypothetical protein